MGCDIHTRAEWGYKDKEGVTHWVMIDEPVFESAYYTEDRPVQRFNTPYCVEPYTGRNYRLFAFLADVRNGRGFAGVDTGDRVEPIAEPRGVPADASEGWAKYVEGWGGDLHSTSWFTLAELKAADWDRRIIQRGVLSESEYLRIKESGFAEHPQSWSGGVSGNDVVTVTPEEYEAGTRGEQATFILWQWESTMREYSFWFLEHTIPGLERNAPKIGDHPGWGVPDERPADEDMIRIVFGFDN